MHGPPEKTARFRFYAELNDFLPRETRQVAFEYSFSGTPSIKDAVEAVGVPHPEVDLVVVNGQSVDWGYHLKDGDDVAVYPVFEGVDITPVVRLRPKPLRITRFVLDVHLGKLARWLRMLGFDTLYDRNYEDAEIVDIAAAERRIILTRDRGLLKHSKVTHGCWVRATDPRRQIHEVVRRLDLRSQFAPFTRCMECNGETVERPPGEVVDRVPPRARERSSTFYQCAACGRIYWEGTHVARMRRLIDELRSE